MQTILRRTFINETVVVDGFFFVSCTFINVLFIFNGTSYKFESPNFENCRWILAGDALATAKFLNFVADGDPAVMAMLATSGSVADRKTA